MASTAPTTRSAVPPSPTPGGMRPPGCTTARKRVGKVVPAVAIAATLAAGGAAYGLAQGGSPQAVQLTDVAQPAGLSSAAQVGIVSASSAGAAASGAVKATRTVSGSVAHLAARPLDSRSPQAAAKSSKTPATAGTVKPATAPPTRNATATTPTATATTPTATTRNATATTPTATTPTATATAASTPTASALNCDVSYGMLPDNVTAIVSFLLANGYSDNAAAGIAGNMYQESGGNPESVGTGGGA